MIKAAGFSLLSLVALAPPPVSSTTGHHQQRQNSSGPQSNVARCRQEKQDEKREKPLPEGEILVGPPGAKNRKFKHGAAWYIDLNNFKTLTVSDGVGHRDSFPVTGLMLKSMPEVTYYFGCADGDCINVILPDDRTYEMVFTVGPWELDLKLVKGIGNACPDEAIRYIGHAIPEGSKVRVGITPHGVQDVQYDNKGDGNFSLTIKPTSHVFAPRAWDSDGPDLKFRQTVQDANTLLVTITAADESGVKAVRYAIDESNAFQNGSSVKVDRARPHVIHAFAEDRLGNRSGIEEFTTKP